MLKAWIVSLPLMRERMKYVGRGMQCRAWMCTRGSAVRFLRTGYPIGRGTLFLARQRTVRLTRGQNFAHRKRLYDQW